MERQTKAEREDFDVAEPLYRCQMEGCAAARVFPASELRLLNGKTLCGRCYEKIGWNIREPPVLWSDLPPFHPPLPLTDEDRARLYKIANDLDYDSKKWESDYCFLRDLASREQPPCAGCEAKDRELAEARAEVERLKQKHTQWLEHDSDRRADESAERRRVGEMDGLRAEIKKLQTQRDIAHVTLDEATAEVERLAADAAIGAAVRRLGDDTWIIVHIDGAFHVLPEMGIIECAPTIPAAVDTALKGEGS